MADDDKKGINGSGECFETAAQMVNAEIQILKGIGDETNIELCGRNQPSYASGGLVKQACHVSCKLLWRSWSTSHPWVDSNAT